MKIPNKIKILSSKYTSEAGTTFLRQRFVCVGVFVFYIDMVGCKPIRDYKIDQT